MTDRIDPDILADLCSPQNLCISPDGKRVVYDAHPRLVRKSDNVQSALWMADVGSGFSATQITPDDTNNHSPKFSPDGKYISFLSDRSEPGKKNAIYLLPLVGGGEACPLTCKDHEKDIGAYAWRQDGKAIAFVKADEKSDERKQRDKDKDDANVYEEDVAYGRLRIVDVDTRDVKVLESPRENITQITWNHDGTKIAYTTSKSPQINDWFSGNRLHVIDVDNDTSKELCYVYSLIEALSWQDDKLLWSAGYSQKCFTTGKSVHSICASGSDESPSMIAYGKTDCAHDIKLRNNKVFVHIQRGLADVIEVLQGSEIYNEKKTAHDWDVYFDSSSSKSTLVVAQSEVGVPTEVYSFADGNRVQLSRHGQAIADMNIGKVHLCEYTHEDGTPIDGCYAVPTSLQSAFSEGKPQPTVLVVRGGPYGRVTNSFDVLWHYSSFFMSLGYLVLCPNYRGGSSHGHDYAAAVYHDASQSYQDVVWLVKKGIEEGKIDPDRVGFTGWSQGGFLAYLSATRDETFHYKAIMAGAGVSDWSSMPLTSDVPLLESELSGPTPWDLEDINDITSRKNSPLYHMQNVNSPVLIIHGELDARTPLEQAVGFYRGMKAKQKDVKMVTYPREGHCVPVPWEKKHYVHMLRTIETFLEKHMR